MFASNLLLTLDINKNGTLSQEDYVLNGKP